MAARQVFLDRYPITFFDPPAAGEGGARSSDDAHVLVAQDAWPSANALVAANVAAAHTGRFDFEQRGICLDLWQRKFA
jgi:hypothetical protein